MTLIVEDQHEENAKREERHRKKAEKKEFNVTNPSGPANGE